MKLTWKKAAAGLLAVALAVGAGSVSMGTGGGRTFVANALEIEYGDLSGTINEDVTIKSGANPDIGFNSPETVVVNGNFTLEASGYNEDEEEYLDTNLSIWNDSCLIINGNLTILSGSSLTAHDRSRIVVTGNVTMADNSCNLSNIGNDDCLTIITGTFNSNGGWYYKDQVAVAESIGSNISGHAFESCDNSDYYKTADGKYYIFDGSAFVEKNESDVIYEAPKHTFTPVWNWASDYSSAAVGFKCKRCGWSDDAQYPASVSRAQEGTTLTYTASYTYEGEEYTDTRKVSTALADGNYKQTASKDGTYYTRFVFVRPLSELEGKSMAAFTIYYAGRATADPYIYETNYYYTSMVSDGITYTPASTDSVLLVVTVSSSSDISEELKCNISFESASDDGGAPDNPNDPVLE